MPVKCRFFSDMSQKSSKNAGIFSPAAGRPPVSNTGIDFCLKNAGEMPGRFIKMPAGAGSRPGCHQGNTFRAYHTSNTSAFGAGVVSSRSAHLKPQA